MRTVRLPREQQLRVLRRGRTWRIVENAGGYPGPRGPDVPRSQTHPPYTRVDQPPYRVRGPKMTGLWHLAALTFNDKPPPGTPPQSCGQ